MSDPTLDPCGCCEGAPPLPVHDNRPGQPALQFRLGTHGTFLQRMLDRMASQAVPDDPDARPLAGLSTRAPDDPAVALLDAWAITADVLTFYQERIANEGYLRTATERRSVLELARAIGYELAPGVAASAYLAFTVEDAPGAPTEAEVPAGTAVGSVPAQGELPQTFETGETVQAKRAWNALRPRLGRPQSLDLETAGGRLRLPARRLYLSGTATGLRENDLLVIAPPVNMAGSVNAAAVEPVRRVTVNSLANITVVDFELTGIPALPAFQSAVPPRGTVSQAGPRIPLTDQSVREQIFERTWSEEELATFLTVHGWKEEDLLDLVAARAPGAVPGVWSGAFALRSRAGFFGHNAPRWETLPVPTETRGASGTTPVDPYAVNWDDAPLPTIWENSQGTLLTGPHAYLERPAPEVSPESWMVLQVRASDGTLLRQPYRVLDNTEESRADYAISGKAAGLTIQRMDGSELPAQRHTSETPESAFLTRKTTAFAGGERLPLAPLPIEDVLQVGDTELMLGGLVLGLRKGQPVALTGERADAPGVTAAEVLILEEIEHQGGWTVIRWETGLTFSYRRDTVVLNANVAPATHGESVAEVLGSGNGAQPNQQFVLKKPPLTYVPAPTASGSESTLAVRVNGILWEQVPSLYGRTMREEIYTVRIEDDGRAQVIFGDGRSGARLPTGAENVTAAYRSGTGLAGEVDAGSLSLLRVRPLGIRGVSNPLPASGAEDPEQLEDARENAPLTVLTLERIVSLRDFESFARGFAGVGKAQAVELWHEAARIVHVTVASATFGVASADLVAGLKSAMDGARSPERRVEVDTFEQRLFDVRAAVRVDPRHVRETVLAAAKAELLSHFSPEARAFGQTVSSAEVIAAVQRVPGVVSVDLDELYPTGETPEPRSHVAGAGARVEGGSIRKAQLLVINPDGVHVEEESE